MNPDVVSARRCSDESVTAGMDASHRSACAAQRSLLSFIAEADRRELWRNDGVRDMCHWLWMRYGISDWKARRWIDSARALERLPHISSAFAEGALGIDKVVELTRFAAPETERRLLPWAQYASSGAIRRRAELEARRSLEEAATWSQPGSTPASRRCRPLWVPRRHSTMCPRGGLSRSCRIPRV